MKITILGAGGVRTPLIVREMAVRQEKLGLDELALMDIDADRLELVGALTRQVIPNQKIRFVLNKTTDSSRALDGADFVITTFRVGGIASRVIDERVALKEGILGQETTGAGGFAMAMRTIPVILAYVDRMRHVCPQAWLINFANPSGLVTEAVLNEGHWTRCAGICDAPAAIQRVAASKIGALPNQVEIDYFGLNHLGWVRSLQYQGKNYVPIFLEMLVQGMPFPELPFDARFLKSLGLIPNEYLFYYYSSRQAVENILAQGETRGELINRMNSELFSRLAESQQAQNLEAMIPIYNEYLRQRSAAYMTAETGRAISESNPNILLEQLGPGGYAAVALDLIQALSEEADQVMVLNTLNQGAIPGMGTSDVVEIPARVSEGRIIPLPTEKIPDHCLGLMKQVKSFEKMTIQAAVQADYSWALSALTIHPLVADVGIAKRLLDQYQTQLAPDFPVLNG